jgi:hypothetical protein
MAAIAAGEIVSAVCLDGEIFGGGLKWLKAMPVYEHPYDAIM